MLCGWLVLVVVAAGGLARLTVETSGESILDKASDEYEFYRRSVSLFGNDEVIVAAIVGNESYGLGSLQIVAEASRVLESTPGVRRVDSLATLPIIEVGPDGELRLDPALEIDARIDELLRREVERRVGDDRIAVRSVVSEDGRVLAINIWPESGIEESYDALLERVRGAIASPGALVSGVPVFRTETNLRTRQELGVFVPITVGVMVVLLFLAFRSARGVVIPLGVSGVSVCLLFGLMGWAGVPVSAPTMILPSVLLAIGCAYSMHLLTEVDHGDQHDLEHSIRQVSRPIALSGVTTAIGFASTAIVPIEAVQRVGALGSLGAVITCAATIGLGGSIVCLWQGRNRRNSLLDWLRERASRELLDRMRARTGLVIGFWAFVLALGVLGAQRLHVESDVVVWFPRGNEVRDAYEEIKLRLAGISPLNVVVTARDGGSVSEPEVVKAIEGLGEYLSSLPEMGKVLSVADPLRELHEGFMGERGAPLPDERGAIEQYLLLLESTERLGDVITRDRSAANVLLRVDDNGSRHLLDVAELAEGWWQDHGVAGFEARTTGSMYEIARAEDAIALGQIQGLGLDILIIATVLLFALRSLRLAVLALIPNILPLGLMFGFMGISNIPLDLGTVFVTNLAVGIAVDETIHLISAFAGERARGEAAEAALRGAMARVVPALLLTTAVIAAGFLVLAVSDFRFTRNLGLLTAGVMVLCVASNATLLPALLLRFGGTWSPRRGTRSAGSGPGISR